jgi:hypothetical protein
VTGWWTEWLADRVTDWLTDWHTNKHTYTHTHTHSICSLTNTVPTKQVLLSTFTWNRTSDSTRFIAPCGSHVGHHVLRWAQLFVLNIQNIFYQSWKVLMKHEDMDSNTDYLFYYILFLESHLTNIQNPSYHSYRWMGLAKHKGSFCNLFWDTAWRQHFFCVNNVGEISRKELTLPATACKSSRLTSYFSRFVKRARYFVHRPYCFWGRSSSGEDRRASRCQRRMPELLL